MLRRIAPAAVEAAHLSPVDAPTLAAARAILDDVRDGGEPRLRAHAERLGDLAPGAPLVLGVDLSRFGDDQSVIRGRKGRDGRAIPPIKWRGMDTVYSAGRIMEAISVYKPEAVFIDGGGVGGGVVDILKSRGYRVIEVNFGSVARQTLKYANKRAEMWGDLLGFHGPIDPLLSARYAVPLPSS